MLDAGEFACVVARRHADVVDFASLHEAGGYRGSLVGPDAAFQQLVAGDADADDRVRTHRVANGT